MPLLIDIHAHLDHLQFEKDLDEVIDRARKAGIKKIITNGIDQITNRKTLKLSKKYDIVEPALGIFPPDALPTAPSHHGDYTKTEFDIDEEIEFIKKSKPIALGEVGMDLRWGNNQSAQTELFNKFISLSEKLDVPMIIHSNKAEKQVIDLLESSNVKKAILHCFCGRFTLIKKAADLGYYFSIPANIVNAQHFQKMVETLPLSNLFTETDCPYLSPFRDKRNEPAFIAESIKKIAETKKLTVEDTANNIFMNFQRLF